MCHGTEQRQDHQNNEQHQYLQGQHWHHTAVSAAAASTVAAAAAAVSKLHHCHYHSKSSFFATLSLAPY